MNEEIGQNRESSNGEKGANLMNSGNCIYQTLVEEQIEAIALLDSEERFTFANRSAEDLFEVERSGLSGRSLREFVDELDQENYDKEMTRYREKGSGKFILKINTKRDKRVLLKLSIKLHRTEADKEGLLSVIFYDISDQKRFEDEVRMVATAMRNANEAVFITNMEDRIIYANPAFLKLYQYPSTDMIGKSAAHLRSANNPPELLAEMLQGTLDGGWQGELLSVRADRSEFPVSVSTSLVRDDKGTKIAIISIVRDLTHDKQVNNELIKVQELEMIGFLARGIAHNFNNILTAIVGYISLAQLTKDNEIKLTSNLAEAEKACARARDLTQQLLGFSKGSGSLRRAASIKELIVDSASFGVTGTNIECLYRIDDKLATVEVDEGQISQVINNLVLNAVEASPEAGVITIIAENTRVKKRDEYNIKPGEYIRVSIRDEGVGISDEDRDKIFDPFFSTKPKRSGLGLTTSFSIIKKHEGYITFDSREGKGSTFNIYLPVSQKRVDGEAEREFIGKPPGGRRVLIMDDERDIRMIIGSFLESFGYEVHCATNGDEALSLLRTANDTAGQNGKLSNFDMAILNLTIPAGKGAKEIIGDIREIDPGIFSVLTTGYTKDPLVNDFREHGFKAVLIKPFDSQNLNQILHLLEEHKAQQ